MSSTRTISLLSMGQYRITENKLLGEGSYAQVWRAKDEGKKVAVKVMKTDGRKESKERHFKNELEALTLFSGKPNIVNLRKAYLGENDIPEKLVFDYYRKGSLEDLVVNRGEAMPTWSVRMQMALQITKAVSYLHEARYAHRDIKAANVMLDGALVPHLGDFGYTVKHEEATENKGTILWLAPEVFQGNPLGMVSDIYSLTLLIWFTLNWSDIFLWLVKEMENANLKDTKTFANAIIFGDRDYIPETWSPALAKLIENGWGGETDKRPTAGNMYATLNTIANDSALVQECDSLEKSSASLPMRLY